jgi:antitoxin VapB
MSEKPENTLREMQLPFRHAEPMEPWPDPRSKGAKPLRAKVFKSGNSLALRLPAALGLEAGMEMELMVQPGGGYVLRPADAPKRKIDVSKFAGKAPWLKELPRYDFEDSPRDWHLLERADKKS